jgi:hypothetical protein
VLSKLAIGLIVLALLFGFSKPANAQAYWGMYNTGYGSQYVHPADTPYFSPYYSPTTFYLAYYTPYYPGCPYGWWWWISWRR